jgi:CheY-like chemotaxis protein
MDEASATILVVDDTEAIRYAKVRTLRRAGYQSSKPPTDGARWRSPRRRGRCSCSWT